MGENKHYCDNYFPDLFKSLEDIIDKKKLVLKVAIRKENQRAVEEHRRAVRAARSAKNSKGSKSGRGRMNAVLDLTREGGVVTLVDERKRMQQMEEDAYIKSYVAYLKL